MARMLRRLPLSLRAWSGALLACALFVCLTGLARPAMSMSMLAAEPMETAAQVMVGGHSIAPASAATPDRGPRCPMASEQCVAPKGVLAQDLSAGRAEDASRVVVCSPSLLVARPNAPPPTVAPPDLHRLCVSRT